MQPMNRRSVSLLVMAMLSLFSIANGQKTKPNVIFILADDLGYGDLGCYGQQKIRTPHIDQLAAEGMKFTQFYSGTSVCAPSRASLMTGLHTGHTPVRGNVGMEPEGQFPIPDNAFTIAELFKNAGYTTGDFGKWGLGPVGSTGDPIKQGFDKFYGYNCQSLAHDYFPDHLWNNQTRIDLPNTFNNQTQYAGDMIQRQALDFMAQNKNKPFFLYLSYTLPHAALQLPNGDANLEYYKKQFNEQPVALKPWNGKGYQPHAYPKAAYAAMVQKMDDYVGQVMQQLVTLGLDKNTLVIFTSDNGPHREGGNNPDFFNSNGGLRGIKRDLYEGGMREPMIARWPASIKAGQVSTQTGAFWDFLPTFAQLTKQTIPAGIDGLSILPTLTAKGKQDQHEYYYWEFHENGGRQAVSMGNWKGVRYNASTNPNGPIELYNLSNDLAEKNNIASANPEIVARIQEIMKTAHVENQDFPFFKAK